jgi:hypothetical protein
MSLQSEHVLEIYFNNTQCTTLEVHTAVNLVFFTEHIVQCKRMQGH